MSNLDDFLRGYVECAIWSSSIGDDFAAAHNAETGEDAAGDCGMLDFGFSSDDLAPETVESMRAECADFLNGHTTDVERYCELMGGWHGSDTVRGADARYSADEQAGADFWLSRNGHGAGYFDRGIDPVFRRLQDAARVYGESTLYVGDDGTIYAS